MNNIVRKLKNYLEAPLNSPVIVVTYDIQNKVNDFIDNVVSPETFATMEANNYPKKFCKKPLYKEWLLLIQLTEGSEYAWFWTSSKRVEMGTYSKNDKGTIIIPSGIFCLNEKTKEGYELQWNTRVSGISRQQLQYLTEQLFPYLLCFYITYECAPKVYYTLKSAAKVQSTLGNGFKNKMKRSISYFDLLTKREFESKYRKEHGSSSVVPHWRCGHYHKYHAKEGIRIHYIEPLLVNAAKLESVSEKIAYAR